MWSVKFLNQKVIDEFEAVNSDLQAKLLKLFERVKIYDPNLGEPHTKNLESGLFELRAKAASGIARSIFCYSDGKTIVILLTFEKKTQRMPKSMLNLAKIRLKEFKNGADRL